MNKAACAAAPMPAIAPPTTIDQARDQSGTFDSGRSQSQTSQWLSFLSAHSLQTKLTIGAVNDPLEREADAAADRVMRMADPAISYGSATPRLSRKCETCEDEERTVHRKEIGADTAVDTAPPVVEDVLRGSGQPLDRVTLEFMSGRFGNDFSDVRIHTGAQALQSAAAVGARAYTVGTDVVFGAGQYDPVGNAGRYLLAHELAHVGQQQNKGNPRVVHRQPTNPNPNSAPTQPAPKPTEFSPNVDCIIDKTNEQIPISDNTVTVIEYGATWCKPCGIEQAFLIELCNEYKAAKNPVPVRFFLVDNTDEDLRPTVKTWPPVVNSMPGLLIYSGKFQTFQGLGLRTPTKAEAKVEIDKAIGCAKDPLKCGPLQEPEGGPGCKIDTAATPTGNRFKFALNTVNFEAGEEAKLDAFVKKIKPKSTINLLGLASSDGPDSTNRTLSCQRALVATSVFARNGLVVDSLKGSGPVSGTDNKPEFRAVDVQVIDPAGPTAAITQSGSTPNTATGACAAPTCIADFVISGSSTIEKGALITDPAAKPADPRMLLQTSDCNPSLYQVIPNRANGALTSNIKILHVTWKKDPPPGTLSVVRNARDDTGDNPDPKQKAPSFAALDPTTAGAWASNVDSVAFRKQGCKTTKSIPSWCVPFCSFGEFTMVATVTWQCDNTVCTNDFVTKPLKINVQKKP
jgi:hypothetical protein